MSLVYIWSLYGLVNCHSEKGLWSKHSITGERNIVDLCSGFQIFLLENVTPDTHTVSDSPKFSISLFYYLLSIYVSNVKWCLMRGIFTDFIERSKFEKELRWTGQGTLLCYFLGAKKWSNDETKANSMVVGETNYILHRRSLIISNRSLGLIWGKSFTKAIVIGLPVILPEGVQNV